VSVEVGDPLAPQTYKVLETMREGASAARLVKVENTLLHRIEVHKTIDLLGLTDALPYNEPSLLVALSHKHVVPVFDAHYESGHGTTQLITFAMPFYPEGSVQFALEHGRVFSIGESIRYTAQLLGALAYMHHLGYVDRDVKSANALLDGSNALLADVGEAARVESDGLVSARRGTWMYMAPEYRTGRIGQTADLYAMGGVLREMLGGLFDRRHTQETIRARIETGGRGLPEKELGCPPHTPPPLRRIVDKALRKEPGMRWQTAAQFGDALLALHYIDWRKTPEGWDGSDARGRQYRVREVVRGRDTYLSCERRIGASGWRRVPDLSDTRVRPVNVRDYELVFDAIFDQLVH
jgi:serine/threonine protein kinase